MELKDYQEKLGCQGCYFCDKKAFAKGTPCCTKIGQLNTSRDGVCLVRKAARK